MGCGNKPPSLPKECLLCLSMTRQERRLFSRVASRNPEFARRFLESLAKPGQERQALPEPKQESKGATEEQKQGEPAKKPPGERPAGTAAPIGALKKIGAGAAGATLVYQSVDNLLEFIGGRDAASSAYGVITDNFSALGNILSYPLVSAAAAFGVLAVFGRSALHRLKDAWNAAAGTAIGKAKAAVAFAASASKAAFAALACYHFPGLIDAGRNLANSGSSQAEHALHLLDKFFHAAPGTILPLSAYLLAKAADWLLTSSLAELALRVKKKGSPATGGQEPAQKGQ